MKGMVKQKADIAALMQLEDEPESITKIRRKCLSYTPNERPTFKQIYEDLTQAIQLLEVNYSWKEPNKPPLRTAFVAEKR